MLHKRSAYLLAFLAVLFTAEPGNAQQECIKDLPFQT